MRVAVVGAGISGLGAAWLLSKRFDVTIFDKEARLGGHSNTVDVALPDNDSLSVDTGFIVFNPPCYPNLVALFDHLGIPVAPTRMTFAVSCAGGRYEYSGTGANGFFGQRANLLNLRHWFMASDMLRFFREARAVNADADDPDLSLGDWLEQRGYSESFTNRFIVPMGAAIWSTPATEMLDFPVLSFTRFFANHGLLQMAPQASWRTVRGGSREYVRRMEPALGRTITGDPVTRVARGDTGVRILTQNGRDELFDACVMASHADETSRLLSDIDSEESRLLGAFKYARNEAVLHTDEAFMPRRRRVWSSWNYMMGGDGDRLSVTYWMNKLQPLDTRENIFVTLNPHWPVPSSRVLGKFVYHHPIFDAAAMRAQRELWSLQGRRRTWFAGSYFGHGFHEDGLQSGLAAAEALGGIRRPWRVDGESSRIHIAASPHVEIADALVPAQ